MIKLKIRYKAFKIEVSSRYELIFEKHEFVSYSSEYYLNIEYLDQMKVAI